MTTITEETGTAQAVEAGAQPKPTKPTKKAAVAKKGANVAPAKAKASKKASPAKKAPKGQKKAPKGKKSAVAAREFSALSSTVNRGFMMRPPERIALE